MECCISFASKRARLESTRRRRWTSGPWGDEGGGGAGGDEEGVERGGIRAVQAAQAVRFAGGEGCLVESLPDGRWIWG